MTAGFPADRIEVRNAVFVLKGNAAQYGQEANVAAHVDADTMVRNTPPLKAIEAVWGPAPGRVQPAPRIPPTIATPAMNTSSAAPPFMRGRLRETQAWLPR